MLKRGLFPLAMGFGEELHPNDPPGAVGASLAPRWARCSPIKPIPE